MLEGLRLKENVFTKRDSETTQLHTTNKNNKEEHKGIKVALKSCLAALSILHHGLTTMAISALNASIQQHASTANQKHPSCSTTSHVLLPLHHSPPRTQPLSLVCFTREPYKQPRDRRGTKDKILIYLGNHGLYLILF